MAPPTMQQFLDLIQNATPDELRAFRAAMPGGSAGDGGGALNPEQKKQLEELLNLETQRAKVLQKSSLLMGDINKSKEQEALAMKKQVELALKLEISDVASSQLADDEKEKRFEALKAMLEQVKAGKEISANLANVSSGLLSQLDSYKKIVPAQQRINDLTSETKDNIDDLVKGMGSFVGLSDKVSGSGIGKMTQLFATIKEGGEDADAAVKLLGRQMGKMFSVQNVAMNIASGIFNQSMKVFTDFDNALASVAGKTGTVGKFNDNLYDAQRAGNLLGVSMDDAANSLIALNAGTSQFAKLNSKTRTDLVIATSQFEKLGVSATDTAEFMENAFKIMNMRQCPELL